MKRIVIDGKPLTCPHCEGEMFERREAQLHTAGLTFFNMEFLNKTAIIFVCQGCGRLEWFLDIGKE